MPLLPLTDPRPDIRTDAQAPADVPFTEQTFGNEWVGKFTKTDAVGATLTAGWGGARIRLLHAQVYEGGNDTPARHVDLLGGDGPVTLEALARRHFGPLPEGTGAVTVQYECDRGSLHLLFEYSPED